MKKLLFPFFATLLLLAGAGSALVGCKDSTTDALTKANKAIVARQNKYRAIDDSIIQAYLTRNKYGPGSYTRTSSGLYLIPITSGTQGPLATAGKQVSVRYEGRFLSQARENVIFDSSYNGRTLCNCVPFLVDDPEPRTRPIAGFNEGLKLMRQGDHKLLLIPSYLAYGASGGGSIGPDTPILFDMEIVGISQ